MTEMSSIFEGSSHLETVESDDSKSEFFRLLLLLILLSGCASYHPLPLSNVSVQQQQRMSAARALQVAAAQLHHPLLAPVRLNLGGGIGPDQAAILAVILSPKLRADRDRRGAYRVSRDRLRARIDRLLSELDLSANQDTRAGRLSGGFKQLLSISCAVIHEPSLLFLDEPTGGLDPVHRQHIWAILYDLNRQGTTIFLSTHYMEEAEWCTDIGFIQGGHLIAKGSPLTPKERLHGKLLEVHVAEVKDGMQILRGLPDVCGVALRSGRLRIQARDPEALLDGWLKRWPYENLRWLGYSWVEPDMEDVFTAHSQRYFVRTAWENRRIPMCEGYTRQKL